MIEYLENHDLASIDGYLFRRDKHTGYYLSSKNIGKGRKRLHIYIWEKYNGAVPRGYNVHHIDQNKDNNEIENLALMTQSEHMTLHGQTWADERIENNKKNLEKAQEFAKKWHCSEEGKEWHRKNGVEAFKKREPRQYFCTYCNRSFMSKNYYTPQENRFCCNNCKSAYRRKMGYDDVVKHCEICGAEFIGNKYQKGKRCEKCKGIRRKEIRES